MAERALAAEVPADANARTFFGLALTELCSHRLQLGLSTLRRQIHQAFCSALYELYSLRSLYCRLPWHQQRDSRQICSMCWVSQSGDLRNCTKRPRSGSCCYRTAHAQHQTQDTSAVRERRRREEHIFCTACLCACSQEQRGAKSFHTHGLKDLVAVQNFVHCNRADSHPAAHNAPWSG